MTERYRDRYSFPRDDAQFIGRLGAEALGMLGIAGARETHFVRVPEDGRQLAVELSGAVDGYPMFLLHGAPGSRTGPKLDAATLQSMGVNLITYDRPGYGYSDPRPGRLPIDTIDDVRAIAEYLELNREFSVIGRSGGGPHALACAAALPGVRNVAALASPAPRELMDGTWLEGMGQHNRDMFADRAQMTQKIRDQVSAMQVNPRALLEGIRTNFAPDDQRVVTAELAAELVESYGLGVQFGPEGRIDDAFGNYEWGFDPRSIRVPTLVWYGGQDPFVPPSNGRWLAQNIPSAREVYVPEASHFRATLAIVPVVIDWCKSP